MKEVLRQEQKYICNLEQYYNLKHYLIQLLHQDVHNDENGYIVRTLYFDTLFDTDFYEKVDGLKTRKKMRLRIYHPDDEYAYLEMKQKNGIQQKKRSLEIKRKDAKKLCQGDYSVLLTYQEEFARECYGVMVSESYLPKVIVEYERLAFMLEENNTRITFDRNVCSTSTSFNLFDPNLNLNPCIDQTAVILEVKFNHFLLSYLKDLICLQNPSLLSISKYYYSRKDVTL